MFQRTGHARSVPGAGCPVQFDISTFDPDFDRAQILFALFIVARRQESRGFRNQESRSKIETLRFTDKVRKNNSFIQLYDLSCPVSYRNRTSECCGKDVISRLTSIGT